MATLTLTNTLVWVAVALTAVATPDKFSSRLDAINVDDVLASERLVLSYWRCLMVQGPCTPEGADLRRILPDALLTQCEGCSPTQRHNADKVIRFLMDKRPEEWAALEAKYDPTGEYRARYEGSQGAAGASEDDAGDSKGSEADTGDSESSEGAATTPPSPTS